LWVIGMVVALLTTALLIVNLHPEIWKGLLEERNLTLIAIGVSVTTIIVLLAVGGAASGWTGFGDKTVWDWLQLLIVPLVLGVIGFYFTSSQEYAHQQEFEEQRLQNAALQTYLAGMRELLLDKHLRDSEEDSEVRAVAGAQTRSTVGQLSPEGKGIAIQFLYEASLIREEDPVLNLSGVGLRGANLSQLDLSDANLSGAVLRRADLHGTNLSGAILRWAELNHADLRDATMSVADLSEANLNFANLSWAVLDNADLPDADLTGANMSGAFLRYADLRESQLIETNLSGADLLEADLGYARLDGAKGVTEEQLEEAKTLKGATMPGE
jgi:uncharacterized protein YjbI with pentapeptide repeats